MTPPQLLAVPERFQALYKSMDRDSVNREALLRCYHPDIEFIDPFHHICGISALTEYFVGLYENVSAIDFQFLQQWHSGDSLVMSWQMQYIHPRINRGHPVVVDGLSELRIKDDAIIYHRDYFDAGQMLYQHLPLLGRMIRWLKRRMAA